jgi:signal peptidase II
MDSTLRLRTRPRIDLGRLAPFLGVAALVVVADQGTKSFIRASLREGEWWPLIGELLRISHVENSGAAFGILQGAGTFLLAATVLGVAALSAYLLLLPGGSRWYPFALALVLGGALGNLIDRVSRGTVTDFIDPTHYPAFNLADSSIFMGVAILLIASYALPDKPAGDADPES